MIVLNGTYGFVGEGALVAPQANAMAAVIQPLMEGGTTPWVLYFIGAVLALVLTSIGVPALAFSLGMFIPMELERPAGGGRSGGVVRLDPLEGRCGEQGSARPRYTHCVGFIAGGALMGVGFSRAEIRGRRLVLRAVGVVERRRMVGVCDVCGSDRLYGLAHDACEARIGVII